MARENRSGGLQIIFSFFLGLMVTAFVGVGVYTFHPPDEEYQRRIQELTREEEAVRLRNPSPELPVEERDRIQALMDERNELADAAREDREAWGRSTSVVLIALATLTMAVSLVRADQLPVISNGLLLGGVFTMVYGVGWIIATDTSVSRFVVMTVALAITLALGYVRFVRGRADSGQMAGAGEGSGEMERRLRELEERMNEAADALGPRRGGRGSPGQGA
jgi:hypothetical protein